MIPKNISYKDILKAIEQIEVNGVSDKRVATKFNLRHEGKLYPPKYAIALANIYANGQELPAEDFSGGKEANSFLENLGFEIIADSTSISMWPLQAHSWEQVSDNLATMHSDKSSFLHNGTIIPQALRDFFSIDILSMSDDIPVKLHWSGIEYKAKLTFSNGRTRLFWGENLAEELRRLFPFWYESFKNNSEIKELPPIFRFEKQPYTDSQHYLIDIVSQSEIQQDVNSELVEEQGINLLEGAQVAFFGKRYERNPVNRMKAIMIHGTKCCTCGFDFEAVYGERGRGFIEVHHTKPLYLNDEEQVVDPKTDLVPVCSNCHRMLHRRKDDVLTVQQLIEILA
jgi:5-methylcytosine-specific restriction protein A